MKHKILRKNKRNEEALYVEPPLSMEEYLKWNERYLTSLGVKRLQAVRKKSFPKGDPFRIK